MDRSLAPMRPSRALQETSHIVFVTSPRNLLRGRGTIDNADVSLVCCDILKQPDVIAIQILRQRVFRLSLSATTPTYPIKKKLIIDICIVWLRGH